MVTKFESFLNKFDESAWLKAVAELSAEMHEVDRDAAQIWFRFFPLSLFRYLQAAEDREKEMRKLVMQGDFDLKNQIDSSHRFLYGHRFWKETKTAIVKRAESFTGDDADLKAEIRAVAKEAAQAAKTNENLTLGIAAIGLMTLVQTGFDSFKNSSGTAAVDKSFANKSPEAVIAERAKDDSQGVFGFLKTVDKKYTVKWSDAKSNGNFAIKNDADIATASALDQSRNWQEADARCWEGVVPVECRSAACGTCWVGVLGGREKLSEVQRLENKQMKIFGYNQPEEEKPFLRLACQAKAHGNVTIVIPPWNAVFGKKVRGDVEENVLEPATSSAKLNREVVKDAVKNKLM